MRIWNINEKLFAFSANLAADNMRFVPKSKPFFAIPQGHLSNSGNIAVKLNTNRRSTAIAQSLIQSSRITTENREITRTRNESRPERVARTNTRTIEEIPRRACSIRKTSKSLLPLGSTVSIGSIKGTPDIRKEPSLHLERTRTPKRALSSESSDSMFIEWRRGPQKDIASSIPSSRAVSNFFLITASAARAEYTALLVPGQIDI